MRYIIKHISFHEYKQWRAPRASKVSSSLISVHFTLLFSVIVGFILQLCDFRPKFVPWTHSKSSNIMLVGQWCITWIKMKTQIYYHHTHLMLWWMGHKKGWYIHTFKVQEQSLVYKYMEPQEFHYRNYHKNLTLGCSNNRGRANEL